MRIEFPHSAREDFLWTKAPLRVGSAADNDLVLAVTQAAPSHLCIEQDERGWMLRVLPAATRVYVNARPVRERAMLRPGDMLSVGDCRMLLREDDAPDQRDTPPAPPQARSTAALRALAGALCGRVLPVGDGLELGAGGRYPLELPQGEVACLRLGWREQRLWLSLAAAPSSHPLRVNGVAVRELALQPGDQISLGPHRLVLDAPGMQPEPALVPAAVAWPANTPAAPVHGEAWWLIATAAVLALGIALVLWLRL